MLGKKSDAAGDLTVISAATTIRGDIEFDGKITVEGSVIGNIKAAANSAAELRIAEGGSVEGDIEVPLAVINGTVKGTVRVDKHLELAARAVVYGDVFYNLIEMVMGSAVNGNLARMDQDQPEIALLEVDQAKS